MIPDGTSFLCFLPFPVQFTLSCLFDTESSDDICLGSGFLACQALLSYPDRETNPFFSFLFFYNQNIAPSCHLVSYLDKVWLH